MLYLHRDFFHSIRFKVNKLGEYGGTPFFMPTVLPVSAEPSFKFPDAQHSLSAAATQHSPTPSGLSYLPTHRFIYRSQTI